MLEDLLIEHFNLKGKAFNDDEYLTEEGAAAYDKLISLLYDLNKVVEFDINKIVDKLDAITNLGV